MPDGYPLSKYFLSKAFHVDCRGICVLCMFWGGEGGGEHFSLRALVGLLIKNLYIQKAHEKEEMLCRQMTEYIIASCM